MRSDLSDRSDRNGEQRWISTETVDLAKSGSHSTNMRLFNLVLITGSAGFLLEATPCRGTLMSGSYIIAPLSPTSPLLPIRSTYDSTTCTLKRAGCVAQA